MSATSTPAETSEAAPSRVIHVRGVVQDLTQSDLIALASPFGRVAQCLLMRTKNQALIQMQDLSSAQKFVEYYTAHPAQIRGHRVYLQYSTHQELTGTGTGSTSGDSAAPSSQNHVLLVTIHNPIYIVNVDVIYQVFSPHGQIDKIVIFNKESAGLQCLIQYASVESATRAMTQLQGCSIYTGGCTLSIQYSKLQDLTVRYNNDRSRDFTNQMLPEGPEQPQQALQPPLHMAAPFYSHPQMFPQPMLPQSDRSVVLVSNLNSQEVTVDRLFNLFSCYGNIVRVRIMRDRPQLALVQYTDGPSAQRALNALKGLNFFGKPMEISFSKHTNVNQATEADGNSAREYARSPHNRFLSRSSSAVKHMYEPTPVLHIANLSPGFTEDVARTAFSQYGTVVATKFFETGGFRQCLMQMGNASQAAEALSSLHTAVIGESEIRVSFSHSHV